MQFLASPLHCSRSSSWLPRRPAVYAHAIGGRRGRQAVSRVGCGSGGLWDASKKRTNKQHSERLTEQDLQTEWQEYVKPRHGRFYTPNASSWPPRDVRTRHAHSLDIRDSVDGTQHPPQQFWSVTDQPGIDMFESRALWADLREVYVILFGVGEKETEGIYSLRAQTADGLPQETIIAFEQEEDAERYSCLLEATMEHLPNVCSITPQELLDFCANAGYNCRLEPKGSLLIPPDFNVGVTDWERSLRLREGHWSVLTEEPPQDMRSSQQTSSGRTSNTSERTAQPLPPHWCPRYSDFTKEDLDSIKARLESLLPE